MIHSSETPLFKSTPLILLGGFLVAMFTVIGILSDPGEIIRQDVRTGPAIAAAKVLVPLFLSLAFITFLAKIKKCKHCGKISVFASRRKG